MRHASPAQTKPARKGKLVIAAGIAAVVGVTVWAAAASLTVNSTSTVGAGSGTVSSCDTDGVTPAYTTSYDTGDGRFEVGTVTVSGIAVGCNGKTIAVYLTNTGGTTSYGSGTATVAGTTQAVTIGTPGDAANVTQVNVAIYD